MLVMALSSILLALATPYYRQLLDYVRLSAATNAFYQAVQLARSEAMMRGVRVDLVPARAPDWRYGWVVVIDTNDNQQADPDELLLHQSLPPHEDLRIVASLRDAKKAYLAFDASGRPRSISSSALPQIGSFLFSAGSQKCKIVIGFLGRLRSEDPGREGIAC